MTEMIDIADVMKNSMEKILPRYLKLGSTERRLNSKNGDYIDDGDGFVHCGICGKAKQRHAKDNELAYLPPTAILENYCDCEKNNYMENKARQEEQKKAEEIKELQRKSRIGARYLNLGFADLQINDNAQAISDCEKYARHFAEFQKNDKNKSLGLILCGKVGTGKTQAAICIANELMNQRFSVYNISATDLTKQMDERAIDTMQELINAADLLIIDDLGAERDTKTAQEQLYSFIDGRYREEKPFIITTNYTAAEIETPELFSVDRKRIIDRVHNGKVIEFKGESFRQSESAAKAAYFDSLT